MKHYAQKPKRYKVAQRAMKQAMLGISLMARIRNKVKYRKTKIAYRISRLKWQRASHV